jgi:hypothetical protein
MSSRTAVSIDAQEISEQIRAAQHEYKLAKQELHCARNSARASGRYFRTRHASGNIQIR